MKLLNFLIISIFIFPPSPLSPHLPSPRHTLPLPPFLSLPITSLNLPPSLPLSLSLFPSGYLFFLSLVLFYYLCVLPCFFLPWCVQEFKSTHSVCLCPSPSHVYLVGPLLMLIFTIYMSLLMFLFSLHLCPGIG